MLVRIRRVKRTLLTCGLVAGNRNQTVLLYVWLRDGIAAASMQPSVINAQDHSIAQTLSTGYRALVITYTYVQI